MTHIIQRTAAVALLALGLSGCATIMHGTSQDVGMSSTPTNARVTVDNQPLGNTPLVARLSRKDHHVIRMELDGYHPFEATVTRRTSGWVWGNIVFGGLIGLAVDAITGGLYSLTPDQVASQMATQTGAMTVTQDGLYVTFVRRADPSWQRIGTLSR